MTISEIEKISADYSLLTDLIVQVEKDFNMAGVELSFKQVNFTIKQFVTHIAQRLEITQKENYQKFSNLFYRIDLPLPKNNKNSLQKLDYYNQIAQQLIKHEFLKVWARKNNIY